MVHFWNGVYLTHLPLVTQNGDNDLGQHWPRLWLVAWRHQAITCSNVDLRTLAFIPDQFHRKIEMYTWHKWHLKILFFKIFGCLPGANGLITWLLMLCRLPDPGISRHGVDKTSRNIPCSALTHWRQATPYADNDLHQHWPRLWLVAWRHQAITCSNVDLIILAFNPDQFHRSVIKYTCQNWYFSKYFASFLDICQGPMR